MRISKFIVLSLALIWSGAAFSQSVSTRVTGAVGGATASATGNVGGSPAAAGAGNPFEAMNTPSGGSSGTGGDWNGGVGLKMGGKTVILKGGVGVESNSSSFRAGAAVPF